MAKSIAEIQPHLESYDRKVRAHAADDLGDTGDAKAVPLLIEALYDESQFIRMAAARSLGRLANKTAVPSLIETLEYPISSRGNMRWRSAILAIRLPSLRFSFSHSIKRCSPSGLLL